MTTPKKLTIAEQGEAAGLTARQVKAAEMLVAGERVIDTAKALKVDRRTLLRWRQEVPAFNRLMDTLRADAIDRAKAVLSGAAEQAARTLARVLTANSTRGAGPRLIAAKDILDRVLGCPAKTEIHVAQQQGQAVNQNLPDGYLDFLDHKAAQADAIDVEGVDQ